MSDTPTVMQPIGLSVDEMLIIQIAFVTDKSNIPEKLE
jgi:hypothetical protein